jgi:hypothetical protein
MELRPSTPDFENDHSSDNSEWFENFLLSKYKRMVYDAKF